MIIKHAFHMSMGTPLTKTPGESSIHAHALMIRPSDLAHVSHQMTEPLFVEGIHAELLVDALSGERPHLDHRSWLTACFERYWDLDAVSHNHSDHSEDQSASSYHQLERVYLTPDELKSHALKSGDVLFIAKGQRPGVLCFKHPLTSINRGDFAISEEEEVTQWPYVAHSTLHVLRPKVTRPAERLKHGEALAAWLSSSSGMIELLKCLDDRSEPRSVTDFYGVVVPLGIPRPWRMPLRALKFTPLPPGWGEDDLIERLSATQRHAMAQHVRSLILREHHRYLTEENCRRALAGEVSLPYLLSESCAIQETVAGLLTGTRSGFNRVIPLSLIPSDLLQWREGLDEVKELFESKYIGLLDDFKEWGEQQEFQYIPDENSAEIVFRVLSLLSIERGHKVPWGPQSIFWELSKRLRVAIDEDILADSRAREVPDEVDQGGSSGAKTMDRLEKTINDLNKLFEELKKGIIRGTNN